MEPSSTRRPGQLFWDGRTQAEDFSSFSTNGYIAIPYAESLKPPSITIESWAQLSRLTRFNEMIREQGILVTTQETNQSFRVDVSLEGESLRFFVPLTPVADRWYHVAFTYAEETGTAKLYLDGQLVGSATATEPKPLNTTPGITNVGSSGRTVGRYDQYRVWNYARSQTEVLEGMTREYSDDARLVIDFRFEDGKNNRSVKDHSVYGNTGYRINNGGESQITEGLTPTGGYDFTILVEDGRGGSDQQTFTLDVVPELRGSIEGHLFDDLNSDGDQDDGSDPGVPAEPNLEGWHLFIDANGNGYPDSNEHQAVTDAEGNYSFDDLLPGSYPVRVSPVAGYETPNEFTATAETEIHRELDPSSVTNYDLAIEQLSLSHIRGQLSTESGDAIAYWKAYVDLDGDGQRDDNEPLARSDRDGYFAVTGLDAGTYTLRPELPAGWADTAGRDGLTVTLAADEISDGNDFILEPTNTSVTGGVHFVTMPETTVEARQVFRYYSVAMGVSSDAITYDLSLAPAGMTIDPGTGLVAWRPTIGQVGEHSVVLRALSATGSIALHDFYLNVTRPNTPPVIHEPAASTAYVGLNYSYDLLTQDAESLSLAYSLTQSPAGASIDPTSGRILWLPSAGDVGSHDFTVEVVDEAGSKATQSWSVDVRDTAPNTLPLEIILPRATAAVTTDYFSRIRARDAIGRPVSWSLTSGPAGLTVALDGSIEWTPTADQLGVQAVEVLATNADGNTENVSFDIEVLGRMLNTTPAIDSTPPASVALGQTFEYDIDVSDSDRDIFAFTLLEGPIGASVHPSRGHLRWTPAADQLGEHPILVQVSDPAGNTAEQAFRLTVSRFGGPPKIESVPPTEARVGQAFLYSVEALDREGDPLTYTLLTAPAGMTIVENTGEIAWTPTSDQTGRQDVVVQVSDGIGGAATQAFAINVSSGVPNLPPVIHSQSPRFGTVGSEYRYTFSATDPEGTTITYSLGRGPDGMSVDSAGGLVTWTPASDQIGKHVVTLIATDADGASALESFEIDVLGQNTGPTIHSAAPTQATAGAEFMYDVLASDADLDPLRFELTEAPAGAEVDAFGRIRWQTDLGDEGSYDFTVKVTDPRGGEAMQSFTLELVKDTEVPRVSLIETPNDASRNILPWQGPFVVYARAIDNVEVASLTLSANGQDIPLDAAGTATFAFDDWFFETINATATAVDTSGNVTTRTISFGYDVPEGWSTNPGPEVPTAIISSPADNGNAFGMVSIIGTANHEDFGAYTLSYRRVDETSFTEIVRSTTPVIDGELGVWDTSLLLNDEYVIRLQVATTEGTANVVEHNVGLAGELKLGNFRLEFTDMVIPVAGIPIEITRVYDTLQADRQGDFGYGWRMEYRNTDLRVGLPKSGLEDIGIFPALRPGVKVYLNVPGEGRQGFTFDPQIRVLPGFGGQNLVLARPGFTPDPGVTSTLSTGTSSYLQVNERGELFAPGGIPYNPASPNFGGAYVLTTRDGISYRINGGTGALESATNRNGVTVEFDSQGIRSDSGVSISILRDSQGRITSVVDPQGNQLEYRYNQAGTLSESVDRRKNVTTYVYSPQRAFYLESVVDPLGRVGTRLNYDEFGRLMAFGADGTGTARFQFEPAEGSQTITAPDGTVTFVRYDDFGNLTSSVNALGHRRDFEYNEQGRLTSALNAVGEKTEYSRNRNGRLQAIADSRGAITRYTYDSDGNVASIVHPDGTSEAFQYDSRGNLVSATGTGGEVTRHVYSQRGLRLRTIHPDGTETQYEYNDLGNVSRQSDADGHVLQYTYDALGNRTSEESGILIDGSPEIAERKTWSYDANGNLLSLTVGDSVVTTHTYNAADQVTKTVDANGNETEFSYTPSGALESSQFADGTTQVFTYDVNGNTTALLGRSGVQRTVILDDAGRPTELRRFDDPNEPNNFETEMRFVIDPLGRIDQLVGPNGETTDYFYEHATLPESRIGAGQNDLVLKTFDARGRVSTTRRGGVVQRYTYDDAGNVAALQWQDGTTDTFEYDAMHRTTRWVDRHGVETRYEYSSGGQLQRIYQDGVVFHNEWDAAGRVTRQRDPQGVETRYHYDQAGRLVKVEEAGQSAELRRDAHGLVIEKINFRGDSILFEHDSNGQVTRETRDGITLDAEYYDHGLIKSVSDSQRQAAYEYNQQLQLSRYVDVSGSAVDYTYDSQGRVTSYAIEGHKTDYSYTPEGWISAVHYNEQVVVEYRYDESGRLTEMLHSNGTRESRQYDAQGRIQQIAVHDENDVEVSSFNYTWNSRGLISSIREGASRHVEFEYDSLARLTSEVIHENGTSRRVDYEYDAAGNRISKRDSDHGLTTYVYDGRNQLIQILEPSGTVTLTYDADGNLIERHSAEETHRYTWNSENRLISYRRLVGGIVTNESFYEYDHNGNRIAETIDGQRVEFLVDMVGDIPRTLATRSVNPDPSGGDQLDFNVLGRQPIMRTGDNGTYHFYSDLHSGVRTVLDTSGNPVAEQTYDAFGNVLDSAGFAADWPGFRGEHQDASTGWIDLRNRQYDPSVGRFTQRDPFTPDAGDTQSRHRFVYTDNNPVHRVDPTGLNWLSDLSAWIIEGVIGAIEGLYELLPHRLINSRFEDAAGNPTSKYTGVAEGFAVDVGFGVTGFGITLKGLGKAAGDDELYDLDAAYSVMDFGIGLSIGGGIGSADVEMFLDKTAYSNSIAATDPTNFTGVFAHYGGGAGALAATAGNYYIRMGDGYGTLVSTPTQVIDTEELINNFFIGAALDAGAWGFSTLSFGKAKLREN